MLCIPGPIAVQVNCESTDANQGTQPSESYLSHGSQGDESLYLNGSLIQV
jgi:hypothetical protein